MVFDPSRETGNGMFYAVRAKKQTGWVERVKAFLGDGPFRALAEKALT